MEPPATNPKIVFIVVVSLAIMALMYVGCLAACVVFNISAQPEIVQSFQAAGIFVLGALSGILASTKTPPPSSVDPGTKSLTATVTTTETSREPEKKAP